MATAVIDEGALAPTASERRVLDELKRRLAAEPQTPPKLVVGGEALDLPRPLLHLLVHWLEAMETGEVVTLVPGHKLLTSWEAASLLHVPHDYLVRLLEEGTIPATGTGADRLLLASDLFAYKKVRDAERRAALDRLVEISEELGLYESTAEPPTDWIRLDPAELRTDTSTSGSVSASVASPEE